jgi:hypothetical protein
MPVVSLDFRGLVRESNRTVDLLYRKLQNAEEYVSRLEVQLGLEGAQWTEQSDEYRTVKQGLVERAYRRALDELECLIVQRLFELTKLNISGTGTCLITHFGTAIIDILSLRLQTTHPNCKRLAETIPSNPKRAQEI